MSTSRLKPPISRRVTLAGLGALAVGATGLATACTTGTAPPAEQEVGVGQLPKTIPNPDVPFDLQPSDDGTVPGILLGYPADPPATVTEPPGTGGSFEAACPINTPAPTLMDQNPVWQEINKQLNATLNISYTPGADYGAKQQSLLAGGELPDYMMLEMATPRLPEVLTSQFADLSEYLVGDKIADYSNLAAFSEAVWRPVAINGGIWGIPQPVPRYSGAPARTRLDILQSLGLADSAPSDAAEMVAFMKEVTDPQNNRWASAQVQPAVDMFAQMHDAPNGWVDEGGSLTHCFETDQYRTALEQVRTLWSAEVFHPDSFATGTFPATFDAGNTVMEYGGFDPGTRVTVGSPGNPDYRVGFLLLPKAEGGGLANPWTTLGVRAITGLKPDTPEKIEEKLRIANWIAAPTGTAEGTLTRYGIEGRNFSKVDGNIVKDPDHQQELLILGYIAGAPVTFTATSDVIAEVYQDFSAKLYEQYASPKEDPTFGFYSSTQSSDGASWTSRFDDVRAQVIQGRAELSAWDEIVAEWKGEVGDTIRGEYEEAIAAAG